ncbi:hypothetical protein AWENTII_012122 [Aspergillus wentii]
MLNPADQDLRSGHVSLPTWPFTIVDSASCRLLLEHRDSTSPHQEAGYPGILLEHLMRSTSPGLLLYNTLDVWKMSLMQPNAVLCPVLGQLLSLPRLPAVALDKEQYQARFLGKTTC